LGRRVSNLILRNKKMVKCNNCGWKGIEQNLEIFFEDGEYGDGYGGKGCPKCKTDEYLMDFYPKPCDTMYHVFTDNKDEYIVDKKEAIKLAKEWGKDYGCSRIYEQKEWNEDEGVFEDGDCVFSIGNFPM